MCLHYILSRMFPTTTTFLKIFQLPNCKETKAVRPAHDIWTLILCRSTSDKWKSLRLQSPPKTHPRHPTSGLNQPCVHDINKRSCLLWPKKKKKWQTVSPPYKANKVKKKKNMMKEKRLLRLRKPNKQKTGPWNSIKHQERRKKKTKLLTSTVVI